MQELKKSIMVVIKPDGKKTNTLFSYLVEELPKFLSENMRKNLNVQVIFVALLHLCNEHNLRLQNIDGELFIIQSTLDFDV